MVSSKENVDLEHEVKSFVGGKVKNREQINYQLWLYIFSVINFMTSILCILTAVFICTEDDQYIHDTELCVNCYELKIHPDDQLQKVQVYEGDICCAKPGHLEEFVHAFADVWHRRKLNKENPRFRDCRAIAEETPKPAIKLIGAHKYDADKNPLKVHWDEEAFNLNTGVLFYSHGKIAVRKSGMFFIYVQIDFLCDLNKFKSERSMSYNVMQVARLPIKGREEIIMKSSSTPPDCNSAIPANYTSHVGTILQLLKGDHIYTKVFSWDTVKNHSLFSFYGMHKVE